MGNPEQRTFHEEWDKPVPRPKAEKPVQYVGEDEKDDASFQCERCMDAPGGCPQCGFRDNGLRAMREQSKKKAG